MKLHDWISERIEAGEARGRKDAYRILSERISELAKGTSKGTVSALTIEQAAGGYRLKKYSKALAISEATNGAVTVEELCT